MDLPTTTSLSLSILGSGRRSCDFVHGDRWSLRRFAAAFIRQEALIMLMIVTQESKRVTMPLRILKRYSFC